MTKFSAYQIKFDKDYLNKLTQDPNSGVFKQNCKFHIGLHPAQFTDFGQSVKDELGRKIGKYDDLFQGIMLGYQNVKLQSDLGVIGLDNCYIHIDIQADFFVFRPEINMVLTGIVTRTTKGHVGCLVYNTFNISLPKPDDEDTDGWLGSKVGIQSEVQFKIIYVDLNSRLPYIRGQLISILSNSNHTQPLGKNKSNNVNQKIKFENSEEEDNETTPKSKKKDNKKFDELLDSMDMVEDPGEQEVNNTTPKNKKKHKKKHDRDMDVTLENMIKKAQSEIEDNLGEQNDLSQKSKKKHKIKDKEIIENVEIKQEDLEETEENKKSKKNKKKKKEKPEYAEQDEEVLKKREKRREKKIKQEQNDTDISLESLDIKSLFNDSSVSLNTNSFGSHTMANNDDKGKRRKSNSVSQEIYLENIKLEEDSDLEKVIKKRKRSKSISN